MQCRFMVSDAMMAQLHDNNGTSSREALAQITAALMTADLRVPTLEEVQQRVMVDN